VSETESVSEDKRHRIDVNFTMILNIILLLLICRVITILVNKPMVEQFKWYRGIILFDIFLNILKTLSCSRCKK